MPDLTLNEPSLLTRLVQREQPYHHAESDSPPELRVQADQEMTAPMTARDSHHDTKRPRRSLVREESSVVERESWRGRPGFSLNADSVGFTILYPIGRSRYRWSDIDGDFVVTPRAVGFRLRPAARKTLARRALGGFQRVFTGFDGIIDARSYRGDPDRLCRWLIEQRARSVAKPG